MGISPLQNRIQIRIKAAIVIYLGIDSPTGELQQLTYVFAAEEH